MSAARKAPRRPADPAAVRDDIESELGQMKLKARLLTNRVVDQRHPVELEGIGTVYVRPLSSGEVYAINKAFDGNVSEITTHSIATAMVDPVMSVDEVRAWRAGAPAGEVEQVGDAIRDLSGLNPGARKERLKSVPSEPGNGIHVLPGDEAGDDRGGPPRADE